MRFWRSSPGNAPGSAVQPVDHLVHDLDVVQHLSGLLLEPVERAEQRAEAELIAAPRERQIEPAALERALQRLLGVGLGKGDQAPQTPGEIVSRTTSARSP